MDITIRIPYSWKGRNEEGWNGYGLRPHWVVSSPKDPFAEDLGEALSKCLDFEIARQADEGSWEPFWAWGQYEDDWSQAQSDWQGFLTVKMLLTLRNFARL